MQQKLRSCLFAIIVSVICCGTLTQAEESTTKNKNTTTTTSITTPKSTTSNKGKVASVNGTVISQEQFDRALAYQQQVAAMKGMTITDEQMSELKKEVLESLISTELLYQDSQKSGIKVEEKEINEAYAAQKQKAQFKTDAEFQAALKQSKTSETAYRAQLKQGLALDRFIKNKFTDKITVSDLEAKKYYDDNPTYFQQPAKVRASHIMMMVDSKADQSKKDEAKKKIEQVMKRLKAGEDFATLAKQVSEDPYTKKNGGDLNYFSKGQMLQPIETQAFTLKKGEISDIVKTDYGYHIIKVTDKMDAKTISYEEAKKDIINGLKNNKVNSSVIKYITELKSKATIQTYPINK
jgi:peptidyl-prolyl cis-trans isomerase C